MPTYIDTVLKEFRQKFVTEDHEMHTIDGKEYQYGLGDIEAMEAFLKSSLEHFTQMVEEKKKPEPEERVIYPFMQNAKLYNQALDDVLSLLTPTTKEE